MCPPLELVNGCSAQWRAAASHGHILNTWKDGRRERVDEKVGFFSMEVKELGVGEREMVTEEERAREREM